MIEENNIDKVMKTAERIYDESNNFEDVIKKQIERKEFSNTEKAFMAMYIGYLDRTNNKFMPPATII